MDGPCTYPVYRILQTDRGPKRPDRPAESCRRSRSLDAAPLVNSAERDSPYPAPTLTRVAHDSDHNFIDRRAIRVQNFVAAVAGSWMTRRSDPLAAVAIILFGSCQDFCQFQDSPPDSTFVSSPGKTSPREKERTRHDCKSPHPDKRKERGSNATTSCSERP